MKRSAFIACGIPTLAFSQASARTSDSAHAVSLLERRHGGRLGVAAVRAGDTRPIQYRSQERFAMCSTFKFLAAGAVLARVDAGKDDLRRRIVYSVRDLLDYSPVTRAHAAQGFMMLSDVCAAAVEQSDNTAGNLIFASIGGPRGLTQYVRSLGDRVTRFDRTEPDLNSAVPGDLRDTTTPAAMVSLLYAFLLGDVLSPGSRETLERWMDESRRCQTVAGGCAAHVAHW